MPDPLAPTSTSPAASERSIGPLAAAQALGPALRSRAAEIDELRRLPADVVEAMADAGLWKFWIPASYGGAEVDPHVGIDTLIELARHDASVAWCSFIANSTGTLAASLTPEWAERIYGPVDACSGGFAQPMGRATPVEGGLRVTGRWSWGSGTQHCTMIGGGTLVVDADGDPAPRADGLFAPFVFFDPADVTFHDTWHVLGIRGSGSGDYSVTDAFVPEGRWVEITNPAPQIDGPLYRLSFYGLLASGVAATSIGIATRAIEEFTALATVKGSQNSAKVLAQRPSMQVDVAKAEATVRSATAFLHDAFGDAWQTACDGDEVTVGQRRLLRLAITDATQRCSDATSRLYRVAGGESVYQRNPLERLLRDANVVTQHAMAAERIYETAGRMTFDLDTDTRML